MCGIFALSARHDNPVLVEAALDAINHRGPNDRGKYIIDNGQVQLGHVRLSILDLSQAGHQPFTDQTGQFVITYNGEIYNYNELKSYLEKKYGSIPWKSNTDTEVIIEGFAKEGVKFLNRLNGIFAFAIYDNKNKLLHVLRDPLGIKPLFVTRQNGGIYFCSELKGLLAIKKLKRTLRQQSLAEQLAFMYIAEPHTIYNEFKKIKPGMFLTYRHGEEISDEKLFLNLQNDDIYATEFDAIEALKETFSAAVKRQLIADVPVSLFLSGGLDSSAVAYESVHSGAVVKDAYTISFSSEDRRHDAQSDDLYYAELMSKKLGLELKIINADRDYLKLLPQLVHFMEDGFTDPAAINTFIICSGARDDGIKVMLSGQGADEYLGGYRRYPAEYMMQKIPFPIRYLISRLNWLLPEKLPGRFNAINRRLKRLTQLVSKDTRSRLLSMYTWTSQEEINNLLFEQPEKKISHDFLNFCDSSDGDDVIKKMMEIDHHYDLMSLNLCYTDRMSMANSVEARVPFLDFDLVRVMNSISSKMKVKNGQGKYIFKKAMEKILPNEIIYRDKAGFGLPIRSWMNESNELLAYYLEKNRILRQGIFNASNIELMLKEQFSGKKDNSYVLFTLLVQQLWLESTTIQ